MQGELSARELTTIQSSPQIGQVTPFPKGSSLPKVINIINNNIWYFT